MTRGFKLIGLLMGTALLGTIGLGAADTQPPMIQVETPQEGASYLLNEPIQVQWSAQDIFPGSGLKAALATQASGADLETGTPGDHIFTVLAEDNAGNQTQTQIRYWVVYDVVIEKPLAPSAFEDSTPPEMALPVGTEIPFSFAVRDYFERPVKSASGTVSVLNAETREIIYIGEDAVGILRYDAETDAFDYTLDTGPLNADEYQVLVQFNDGRTIFRIDLTLEPSESS